MEVGDPDQQHRPPERRRHRHRRRERAQSVAGLAFASTSTYGARRASPSRAPPPTPLLPETPAAAEEEEDDDATPATATPGMVRRPPGRRPPPRPARRGAVHHEEDHEHEQQQAALGGGGASRRSAAPAFRGRSYLRSSEVCGAAATEPTGQPRAAAPPRSATLSPRTCAAAISAAVSARWTHRLGTTRVCISPTRARKTSAAQTYLMSSTDASTARTPSARRRKARRARVPVADGTPSDCGEEGINRPTGRRRSYVRRSIKAVRRAGGGTSWRKGEAQRRARRRPVARAGRARRAAPLRPAPEDNAIDALRGASARADEGARRAKRRQLGRGAYPAARRRGRLPQEDRATHARASTATSWRAGKMDSELLRHHMRGELPSIETGGDAQPRRRIAAGAETVGSAGAAAPPWRSSARPVDELAGVAVVHHRGRRVRAVRARPVGPPRRAPPATRDARGRRRVGRAPRRSSEDARQRRRRRRRRASTTPGGPFAPRAHVARSAQPPHRDRSWLTRRAPLRASADPTLGRRRRANPPGRRVHLVCRLRAAPRRVQHGSTSRRHGAAASRPRRPAGGGSTDVAAAPWPARSCPRGSAKIRPSRALPLPRQGAQR